MWVTRFTQSILRQRKASITIEAALLLPMTLLLLLFFVFMIHAAVIYTSLQSAALNTVKQVAAHMYPLELLAQRNITSKEENRYSTWLRQPPVLALKQKIDYTLTKLQGVLPAPLNQWIAKEREWFMEREEAIGERAQARMSQSLFKPLLIRYGVQGVLKGENIRITYVKLPDLRHKRDPYLALEVEYDLPMRVPFLHRKIILAARAVERVWIGDGPQDEYEANTPARKKQSLRFVHLTPEPIQPGRKANLTVKAMPHQLVELVIYYKSGKSQAQHIGWAMTDVNGYVSWKWHISGNTTAGIWTLVVYATDGSSGERQFTVH